jgi:DNA-directed RNA polymerase subunit RPC12/RpoP
MARGAVTTEELMRLPASGGWLYLICHNRFANSGLTHESGLRRRMRHLGLIPRNRSKWVPIHLRVHHEYCFFLHDQCVQVLSEYERAKAHHVTVKFPSKATADQFSKIAAEDPIKALQATGYPAEARRAAINHITMAMVSDCLHHIYEGLRCFEKRKIVVAFNLLRKPLKDNLLYLAWMLGDEDDFYSSFMSGNPEVLTQKTLGNRRLGIFTKAVEKTAVASVIDPALINQILFDRRSAHSLELAFQHAVHLVTDMHVELRTSPQNFNFIFKSYAEDDTYDGAYRWLPYVLLFLSHVIIALFDRMHPMDAGARLAHVVRTIFAYALVEDLKESSIQKYLEVALAETMKCAHCGAKARMTRSNAAKIAVTESFRCTSCGKKNPFPFSYLF